MSLERKMNNRQLLDALDCIDDRFVAELVTSIRPPETETGEPMHKRALLRSAKQVALLAACAVLLSAAIPLVGAILGRMAIGTGTEGINPSGSSGEYTPMNSETKSEAVENDKEPLKAQTGDAFDGSPIFRVDYRADDLSKETRFYTAAGEKIDLCICNSSSCICVYTWKLCWENMICVIEEGNFGYTNFIAYDVSDPNNIKHTKIRVDGISYDTHEIWAEPNSPYFCAYRKGDVSINGGRIDNLIVIDLSEALEGKAVRRDYPSYYYRLSSREDRTEILGIDGEAVYFGIRDGETHVFKKIARALPGEKTATTLFELPESWHFGMRDYISVRNDGTIDYFRDELDENSQYGYSLCQYIWREGEKVEKVIRVTDICDYILADGYIYYAVNDPKYSRKFQNYDVSYSWFTDMTGGIIYRLPATEPGYEPMVAWTLGEEYYLYGVTEKNPGTTSPFHEISSLPIFVQGVDGGIALWANKQVGENIMHVNLLIGDSDKGIVMTELPGCMTWGYYVLSDVGGGTNINWKYKPE